MLEEITAAQASPTAFRAVDEHFRAKRVKVTLKCILCQIISTASIGAFEPAILAAFLKISKRHNKTEEKVGHAQRKEGL